jgi:hypothetical protein
MDSRPRGGLRAALEGEPLGKGEGLGRDPACHTSPRKPQMLPLTERAPIAKQGQRPQVWGDRYMLRWRLGTTERASGEAQSYAPRCALGWR